MGEVKECRWCKKELTGRQERWCGDGCRREAYRASKAAYYLSALPQEDFRAAIREACERRWPKGTKTNRLKIRFGKYNPKA